MSMVWPLVSLAPFGGIVAVALAFVMQPRDRKVYQRTPPRPRASALRRRDAAEQIKLVVGAHSRDMRHAVRQRKQGSDRSDVPDVFVAEALQTQAFVVLIGDRFRRARQLHGKVEHRLL